MSNKLTMAMKLVKKVLKTEAWRRFATHWLTYFTFRVFGYPKFDMQLYFTVRDILRKEKEKGSGAVWMFVGQDRDSLCWKLEKLLLGEVWGHAGLIGVGEDGELWIRHVKNDGLRIESALRYLREVDRLAVGKMKLASKLARASAQERVKKWDAMEVEYDFQLELKTGRKGERDKRVYCSEYVFRIGEGIADGFEICQLAGGEGVEGAGAMLRFTPDDVWRNMDEDGKWDSDGAGGVKP